MPGPTTRRANDLRLTVRLPAEAKVFINDRPTTSTGSVRTYVSRELTPGESYTYQVRAELVRDGQTLTETRTIRLRAGEQQEVAFAFDQHDEVAQAPVKTVLRLIVPADAKVTLAGKETEATGEVREFVTTRLAADGEWANYPIRVEVLRDGQVLTQEKTITLKPGDAREVTFDFEAAQLAQAVDNSR
jgi:uncharacterized protein (TIGR03000 family)